MNIIFLCEEFNIHMERISNALKVSHDLRIIELSGDNQKLTTLEGGFDIVVAGPLNLMYEKLHHSNPQPIVGLCMALELEQTRMGEKEFEHKKSAISSFTSIVVDCEYAKTKLINEYRYKGPIAVIPYGCNISSLSRVPLPSVNECKIFVNRNWHEVHGNELILRALNDVSVPISITFAGDGPLRGPLRDKYSHLEHSGRAKYLGVISPKTLPKVLEAHPFYLSAAASDGASVSLLEAMAAGRVCCTSDFESNLEWIQNGVSGFTFKNGNVESLREMITELSRMESADLKHIASSAREVVTKKGNWDVNSSKLRDFVEVTYRDHHGKLEYYA